MIHLKDYIRIDVILNFSKHNVLLSSHEINKISLNSLICSNGGEIVEYKVPSLVTLNKIIEQNNNHNIF